MARFTIEQAAMRAGVPQEDVERIVALGILKPQDDTLSPGDVRRIGLVAAVTAAGLPLEGLADQVRAGRIVLDFLDNPEFDHFSALSDTTFEALSAQTDIPVELVMVIREAIGSAMPQPTDRVREIELAIVPLVRAQLDVGYPDHVVERGLRVLGESLRRHVLADADAFATYVIGPVAAQAGSHGGEIGIVASAASKRLTAPLREAMEATYRAQQAHAWTANMLAGFERDLVQAGLVAEVHRPPAMCFLDITGYTRLTAERGDRAAADLADELGRMVNRTSVQFGGRPVKWLGDGVMFWFRDPGPGVVAALTMAQGVADAGLPPAHVGLHAGAVLFQDGDYYGQTVNLASRIAEYARPGEVLVSQAVVDAVGDAAVAFARVGPVELKGVAGPVELHAARPA